MNLGTQRPVLAADVFVAPNASVIGDVLCYDRSSVWYGAVVRGDKNKVRIGRVTNILDRAVLSTVETPAVDSGFPSDLNIGSYVTVGQGSVLTSCSIGESCHFRAAGAAAAAAAAVLNDWPLHGLSFGLPRHPRRPSPISGCSLENFLTDSLPPRHTHPLCAQTGDGTQIQPGVVVQEGAVVEKNCIVAAGSVVQAGTLIPAGQFWAGNPAKYIRDVADAEIGGFEKAAEATANLALEHADEFLPFGTAHVELEARGGR